MKEIEGKERKRSAIMINETERGETKDESNIKKQFFIILSCYQGRSQTLDLGGAKNTLKKFLDL